MPKSVIRYNLMVAHSGDTSEYVSTVKEAIRLFCINYEKYNENGISFDVQDYNDATFSTYSEKRTQTIVFEQFAGHADLIIALIGKRIGDGLREELTAAKKERKQTFIYLDSTGLMYDVFNPDEDHSKLEQDVNNIRSIAQEFSNTGYAKPFANTEQLKEHIINDLSSFLRFRRSVNYELKDLSYREFSLKEVDRYREEIAEVILTRKKGITINSVDDNRVISHSKANINEMMRLLREMISEKYNIDHTDVTVTFTWGYHNPDNEHEQIILPSQDNIVLLNHYGSCAKIKELLCEPTSLLRFMLVSGASYKWYQYKSFAYKKGRYYWSSNEVHDKKMSKTLNDGEACGGSIFCYRIGLNGDGTTTNNYVVGFIMVSTGEHPITNTTHEDNREQVKQTIKHMIDFRIKPQLLVEMAVLYLSHLKQDFQSNNDVDDELKNAIEAIQEDYKKYQEKGS